MCSKQEESVRKLCLFRENIVSETKKTETSFLLEVSDPVFKYAV